MERVISHDQLPFVVAVAVVSRGVDRVVAK